MPNRNNPPFGEPIPAITAALANLDITQLGGEAPEMESVDSALRLNEYLPNLSRTEPTAILLDVNNLYKRAQANDFRLDYIRLRQIFETRCDLRYMGAFSAVDAQDPDAVNWVQYLREKGYDVVTKDLKRYVGSQGTNVTKGNMDIEIAVKAMSLSSGILHVIIGTCDGDFIPLIDKLREGEARKVSVLGVRNPNSWVGMSEELVRSADNFYDLGAIKDYVSYKNSRNG